MKSSSLLVVAAACVALGACASTQHKPEPARAATTRPTVDSGKVAAVDEWAQSKHATVMWVHYPQNAVRAEPSGG